MSSAEVKLEVIPRGLMILRSTTSSQVERFALPTISPAAVNMAFEYWNAARNFAVGFAEVAARTYSARVRTPGSAARSALAMSPVRWLSMSLRVTRASASGSAILKYGKNRRG